MEDPQKLALEWLNNILARVRAVEAENARLQDFIAHRPTGTKAQREQQMLKRMEAAETLIEQQNETIVTLSQKFTAENARLREALAPFREWFHKLDAEFPDEKDDTIAGGIRGATFTFGDLRRARAAWAEEAGQ